jgi:radical SAM/Cys-rich protein
VEIIASLPYFLERQTDAQRGGGVFRKSIEALRLLNSLGYGQLDSPLRLNLVFNPAGAYLPPAQHAIEADYKRELQRRYGVVFHSLYTITNMPISRFLEFLLRSGNYEGYMEKLVNGFNPAAVDGLMCRSTISIGWDGRLYDCDFNQMLDMAVTTGASAHIRDFDVSVLGGRVIATGAHCFGCTAGNGSSCGGQVV